MALHQKVEGVWTQAQRPYVKTNGVWTAGQSAWVKRAGIWVQAYDYDVTPPNPPEITLSITEDRNGSKLISRWIRVGVRLPGASHDPDARLTRILTTYDGKPPTTQFGGTYTSATDATYGGEPWSEWRYNEFGPHKDTSVYAYKQWPRNAKAGTIITGDKDYFFGGWSLDRDGNWSTVNQASIHVPKGAVDAPNIVVKEARFQPNESGSWRTEGFVSGDLIQSSSPHSTGLWFYGHQFVDSIGAQTTGHESIKVKNAQIYVVREGLEVDTGMANANVYLFWTAYNAPSVLPPTGQAITRNEITKIGELAKGQGKWFDLPASYNNNLNKLIKGLGLDSKDPVKATAFPEDYSEIVSTATNLRCGEVHIVWEETL